MCAPTIIIFLSDLYLQYYMDYTNGSYKEDAGELN